MTKFLVIIYFLENFDTSSWYFMASSLRRKHFICSTISGIVINESCLILKPIFEYNKFSMAYLRRIFFLGLLITTAQFSNAQSKVNFITKGNLRTVFDVAKAQNKKVFLEVYAPDCHLCSALEPAFTNSTVAKYYNENFISYKMDMYNMETQAFLKKQKVTMSATPTLLFYNSDVKIIYQVTLTEQRLTADALLEEAKKALSK